jgi:hypothetical protein
MKLFAWKDGVLTNYGGSLVVAVADTVEQARSLAIEKIRQDMGRDFAPEDLDLGEPSSVSDLPAAAWFSVGGL